MSDFQGARSVAWINKILKPLESMTRCRRMPRGGCEVRSATAIASAATYLSIATDLGPHVYLQAFQLLMSQLSGQPLNAFLSIYMKAKI